MSPRWPWLLAASMALNGCDLFPPTGGSPYPPAGGLSADRPVFLTEHNGVVGQPWGAAGFPLPQQLFWNDVDMMKGSHVLEMRADAAGLVSDGRVPQLGVVAWGYEYAAATGTAAPGSGIGDNSSVGGWKEWGAWMQAHPQYASTNWNDQAEPGYFTPLMPMDPADWPASWTPPAGWVAPPGWVADKPAAATSYAQWLGIRLAQLALATGSRGMYCADYVVGLEWGDAVDYNPRVVDDFGAWAGLTIPAGTASQRAAWIQLNAKSLWWDFKAVRFGEFYGSMARNLLDNGTKPLVGGQMSGYPMLVRGSGSDFRIFLRGPHAVAPKHWFFNVELQSDPLRPPPDYWLSSILMGVSAAREPDMPLGAQMDALGGQGAFDAAVRQAGHDRAWALKDLTQQWLSVGWSHIAGRDGAVRRAPLSFMRSYWDAGTTPAVEMDLLLGHVPKHPFGPALYYSVPIERTFEVGDGKVSNNWWNCQLKLLREVAPRSVSLPSVGNARGLALGYYVSDAGLARLQPVDYPSAWIVYDSDRLPADERAALERMAPIVDIDPTRVDFTGAAASRLLALGPVSVDQGADQALNCLAFVDQHNSVIVMVSNSTDHPGTGTLRFRQVADGRFPAKGLLGTRDATLVVKDGEGRLDIALPDRGTLVLEIPDLRWMRR